MTAMLLKSCLKTKEHWRESFKHAVVVSKCAAIIYDAAIKHKHKRDRKRSYSSSSEDSSDDSDSSESLTEARDGKHKRRKHSKREGSHEKKKSKHKKKKKKHKKKHKKKRRKSETESGEIGPVPPGSMPSGSLLSGSRTSAAMSGEVPKPKQDKVEVKRSLAPMTKEAWEKQRSQLHHVFDAETGRNRLVRGSGEIVEEIVSKERQKEINKQATASDSLFYRMKAESMARQYPS